MSKSSSLTQLTPSQRRLVEEKMNREVKRAELKIKRQLQVARQQLAAAKKRAQEAEHRLAAQAPQPAERVAAARAKGSVLVERMLPDLPVPSPSEAALAQRSAEARWNLLQEFGAYTSEDLADLRSQAKNRHALANRWRSEGKVFSVEHRGQRLYPGFQFDSETFAPKQGVAPVLAALPRDRMSKWEVALWWAAGNGWLDGERPVDLLEDEPQRLVDAAAHLSEPSPF